MKRPRIHVLYEHDVTGNPHGCAHIRLLRPLSHPVLGRHFDICFGLDLPPEPVDLLIVERLWRADIGPEDVERILAWCAEHTVPLVYMLDDDLLTLRSDEPWQIFPQTYHRLLVARLVRAATLVVVATEELARRLAPLNGRLRVVPNHLDERLYCPLPPNGRHGGIVRFGYMGTYTHLDDLLLVLPALRHVLTRHRREIEFEIVGVAADQGLAELFAGLPVRIVSPGDAFHYPDFVIWMQRHLRWDFAIAPLCDTHFNRAKSDLKFLDYGMLGIPGIFSRVPAYADTVRDEVDGFLVDNDTVSWQQALERLLGDASLRRRLGAAAKKRVMTERTLTQGAALWRAALGEALARR